MVWLEWEGCFSLGSCSRAEGPGCLAGKTPTLGSEGEIETRAKFITEHPLSAQS